jgi:hypothetical protein
VINDLTELELTEAHSRRTNDMKIGASSRLLVMPPGYDAVLPGNDCLHPI